LFVELVIFSFNHFPFFFLVYRCFQTPDYVPPAATAGRPVTLTLSQPGVKGNMLQFDTQFLKRGWSDESRISIPVRGQVESDISVGALIGGRYVNDPTGLIAG
jgi:hypothetical protein